MIFNLELKQIHSSPIPGENIRIFKKNVSNPIFGRFVSMSLDSFIIMICSRSTIEIKFTQVERIHRREECH